MRVIALLRSSSVKAHNFDAWVSAEEGAKIICFDGIRVNVCVQATYSNAGVQHVPQGNAPAFQREDAIFVSRADGKANDRRHDLPKRIARMSVVFAGSKRLHARHTAENENPHGIAFDWREASDAGDGCAHLKTDGIYHLWIFC